MSPITALAHPPLPLTAVEHPRVSLDRSLELFAEGRRLAERCHDLLSEAEQKVKTLVKTAEGFREEPGLQGGGGKEAQ